MEHLHISIEHNVQMPYIIRVWAIRDIILSIGVLVADRAMLKTLLLACIAIDATDILSAHLGGLSGIFNATETTSLRITAIAALVPESIATLLLFLHQRSAPNSGSPSAPAKG